MIREKKLKQNLKIQEYSMVFVHNYESLRKMYTSYNRTH